MMVDAGRYSLVICLPKYESINAFDNSFRKKLTENTVLSGIEIPKMIFEGDYELEVIMFIKYGNYVYIIFIDRIIAC